jgi:hypothetical protein
MAALKGMTMTTVPNRNMCITTSSTRPTATRWTMASLRGAPSLPSFLAPPPPPHLLTCPHPTLLIAHYPPLRTAGGHDSIFENNIVIVRPFDGQNCMNMWAFVPGHQDKLFNNTCAIWQVGVAGKATDADMVLTQNDCGACGSDRSATPVFAANAYYTTHGNASVNCGGPFGTTIAAMQGRFADFERGSTWHTLPAAATVVQWGRDVLQM